MRHSSWKLLDTPETQEHNEPKIRRVVLRGEFVLVAWASKTRRDEPVFRASSFGGC